MLGLLQFRKGDIKQSLDCLSRAISLDPNQAVYCNNYGAVLLSAGLADEASRFLERVVSLQKGYIDAWLNLGRAQQSLKQSIGCGRWSEAIAAYRTLLGLTPKDATVWNDLGGAFSPTIKPRRPASATSERVSYHPRHPRSGSTWASLSRRRRTPILRVAHCSEL